MSVLVTQPGLQTTIQANPRSGSRHMGVPSSGPADSLSMALANRLLGNAPYSPALEITLTGIEMTFESAACFAITGAACSSTLNGRPLAQHQTQIAAVGDRLQIGAATNGARVYVGFAGGLVGDEFLASASTYLPAALGGYRGRTLQAGDRLTLAGVSAWPPILATPAEFRPPATGLWAVRACPGAEFDALDDSSQEALFDTNFVIGARNDRMGLKLRGRKFKVSSAGLLDSVPVFPGCVQCPEDGAPYLLGVDAQTTGGYPRIAQVARADRHVLGQLSTGDHLRLLQRTPGQAAAELREKHAYWRAWLPDITAVL